MFGRSLAGQHENAGADNAADAHQGQVDWTQYLAQAAFFALIHHGFGAKQVHGLLASVWFMGARSPIYESAPEVGKQTFLFRNTSRLEGSL